ncbi:hypothetical protein [Phormidesmis priestleyi]|uniref:hypothetical protein n=1 Tax=Phormidesmis priestleyi TaxID=268141 RepID=UPI0012E6F885|nr:hypothetical protein [Phormidesmis priestleyi]
MQSIDRLTRLSSPLHQFWTQPIFSAAKVTLNPFEFWNRYRIQHLEACWSYDSVPLLERCWVQEWGLKKPF